MSFAIGVLLIILIAGIVLASNHTEINDSGSDDVSVNTNNNLEGIDKAYQCLRDEIDGKTSLSFQEAIFSALALGSNSKAISKIDDEKRGSDDCWPESACKTKESSQALLVYDRIGKNTEDIKNWIKDRIKNAEDLTWYLEIDIQNHEASSCKVRYDGSDKTINVNDDLTLSGSGGSCLSVAAGGYWLRINNNCLDKEFEVSCEDDFITTLLYQRGSSGTLYVSGDTHSAPSLGTTKEEVKSKCLTAGSGNKCSYEDTLWGALALDKEGEDVDQFIPYLSALAENNKKYFPHSFLYILKGREDSYNEISQSQKNDKYWEIVGSPGNRFYDTSLGLLSLAGTSSTELLNAQNYLLDIQQESGCWDNNNIASTAFVLYSGFSKSVSGSGSGGTGESASCENLGNYCESSFSCLEAGGLVLNSYDCTNFREVCCSVDVREQSCSEKAGVLCSQGQECSGRTTSSIEGSCCLDSCVNKQVESTCEISGGSCRTSCFDDEEIDSGETCSFSGDVCCVASGSSGKSEGISIWIWIILIVLIIIVALAIWKRNKIRLWMHRRKGDVESRPIQQDRRGPPRFGGFAQRGPLARRPVSRRPRADPEFDETMRKLREIGK
jgi:hypothetical protein